MTVERANILRGPAIIQMGGESIYTKGDIRCAIAPETFPIETAAYGKVGERVKDVMIKLTFTPVGMWTADLLAVLFPYTNPTIGSSVFGAADVPVTLHPINGSEKIVFTAGAVTRMPNINLTAVETSFGEMEITILVKNNADRSAADALWTLTASAAFTDTSFDMSTIYTVPYTAALASLSAPWNGIETEAGVSFEPSLSLTPVTVDSVGVVDMTLSGLDIVVKMKPIGMTVAQVMAQMKLQGTGVTRGMDLSASANNLTVSGGSGLPQLVVNSLRLKNSAQVYGAEALRHDMLEFVATRPTGGAMFTVGLAA